MNNVIKSLWFCTALMWGCNGYTADAPAANPTTPKSPAECIQDNTQSCIVADCLTSEQIDCQDNCKKQAQKKCK